jgi:hypothetical protein
MKNEVTNVQYYKAYSTGCNIIGFSHSYLAYIAPAMSRDMNTWQFYIPNILILI